MERTFPDEQAVMRRALELARLGCGRVEPNPQVGAVIVDDQLRLLGEGYHQQFGGPHAELHALHMAGQQAHGATLFVTLEPCCHHGKTPPCSQAVIAAGIRRVVIGTTDPFPQVAGGGIAELRAAGIRVDVSLLELDARRLIAPFAKLTGTGLPYVHAKWAMTLDGKLATRTGSSQWISNSESRQLVHALRGRMDAILVGAGTLRADDPLLTARPPGPRTPIRIVIDSHAELPLDSQLVRTLDVAPVLVAAGPAAPRERMLALRAAGVEVWQSPSDASAERVAVRELLCELGRRRLTNVLVEGGSTLLGSFQEEELIDEYHVFIAPKIVGGSGAPSPVGGLGVAEMQSAISIETWEVRQMGGDVYIHGARREA